MTDCKQAAEAGDSFPEDLEYLVAGRWIAEADMTEEEKAAWLDAVLLP